VIVDKIDVADVYAVESENDSPIRADSDGMKSFQIALQRMQSQRWPIHGLEIGRMFKDRQDATNTLDHFRRQLALIVSFVEALRALMAKAGIMNYVCKT
jgi:hypothetical protein